MAADIYRIQTASLANLKRYPLDRSGASRVLPASGIYLLFAGDGSLSYVGSSKNLRQRLASHCHKREQHTFACVLIDGHIARRDAEHAAIAVLNPKDNKFRCEPYLGSVKTIKVRSTQAVSKIGLRLIVKTTRSYVEVA